MSQFRGWESGTAVSHLLPFRDSLPLNEAKAKKTAKLSRGERQTEYLYLEIPITRATPDVLVILTNEVLFLLNQSKVGFCCLQPRVLT